MSGSNRNKLVALGLVFVLAFGLCAWWQIDRYAEANRSAREYATQNQEPISESALECAGEQGLFLRAICLAERTIAYQEAQYAKHDLKAQQDMALWTLILTWVGVCGVALSVVGVGLVYATLRESQRTAGYAQGALEETRLQTFLQHRPWLVIQDFEITDLRLHSRMGDGVSSLWIEYRLVFENLGQTPALGVHLFAITSGPDNT